MIHRDLKPENIFIHRSAGEDIVKVLDFGVAKLTQSDVGEHTTQGSLVGTLRYMAPEQIAGDPPDPRIDVYSMGVLLYEMLSGAVPYDTRDRYVLMRQIIAGGAERYSHASARAPRVPVRDRDARAGQEPGRALQFGRGVSSGAARVCAFRGRPLADPLRRRRSGSDCARGDTAAARPIGLVSHPGCDRRGISDVAPATAATEYLPASPPRPSRARWLIPFAVGSLLLLTIAGGLAGYLYTTPERPTAPRPVPATAAVPTGDTRPAPLRLPALPVPVASPTVAPHPTVAPPLAPSPSPTPTPTRMVMVTTTPPGARVNDADGTNLCPSTPCVIPVLPGHQRSVQITQGTTTLSAVLDGTQPLVQLDLAALATPPATPHTHGNHPRPRGSDEGLPMFLPGGGH